MGFDGGVTDPFLRQDMTIHFVELLRVAREERLIIRTGQNPAKWGGPRTFLHSCAQRLGLQRLSSTIAIRVILSAMMTGERTRTMFDDELTANPRLDLFVFYRARLSPKIEIEIGGPHHVAPINAISRLSDWLGKSPPPVLVMLRRRFTFSKLARHSGVSLSP